MTPPPMMTTRARAGNAVLTRPTYPPRARLGSPSPVERRQHAVARRADSVGQRNDVVSRYFGEGFGWGAPPEGFAWSGVKSVGDVVEVCPGVHR